MAAANKVILERANAAVVRGDHEGFLAHCTDDVEWDFVGDQTLRGKEAVRQYMHSTYVEPPTFVVEHLIAEGEFVTATGTIDLRDAAGRTSHFAYCDVWRVRDGKLAALKAYVVEIKNDGPES